MQDCKSQTSEAKSSKINEMPQPRLIGTPSHQYDYFIEGYQLPPEEKAIRNRLLDHMPTLKTRSYRQSLLKIVSSLSELDHFSDNLETKVDKLLQAQETTFVQSYQQHIGKIQKQFGQLHKQIHELQQKVRYYENQGKMSALIKKVFQLQQQSSKLFKTMVNKDRKIKDQELTIAMLKKQMKILQQTVKSNAREKSQRLLMERELQNQEDEEESIIKVEDMTVFPTELHKKNSIASYESPGDKVSTKHIDYITSHKSVTYDVQNNLDTSSNNLSNSKSKNISFHQERLSKQNRELRMKNKKLLTQQTRMIDCKGQMQQFFVRCVEQLRKEIRIRKKMEYCSFQDFKKEDKLMLMIKVLSNNEILSHLYNRIFNKQPIASTDATVRDEKLPKINFNLTYEKR